MRSAARAYCAAFFVCALAAVARTAGAQDAGTSAAVGPGTGPRILRDYDGIAPAARTDSATPGTDAAAESDSGFDGRDASAGLLPAPSIIRSYDGTDPSRTPTHAAPRGIQIAPDYEPDSAIVIESRPPAVLRVIGSASEARPPSAVSVAAPAPRTRRRATFYVSAGTSVRILGVAGTLESGVPSTNGPGALVGVGPALEIGGRVARGLTLGAHLTFAAVPLERGAATWWRAMFVLRYAATRGAIRPGLSAAAGLALIGMSRSAFEFNVEIGGEIAGRIGPRWEFVGESALGIGLGEPQAEVDHPRGGTTRYTFNVLRVGIGIGVRHRF